jgi:hypothetical protein
LLSEARHRPWMIIAARAQARHPDGVLAEFGQRLKN